MGAPAASPITAVLAQLHERLGAVHDGEVATYIPELARVDPDRFGIAVAMADGTVYEVGDSRHPFTIQSVSKAFTFGLALRDHGRERLLEMVGVEPTGDPFNAIELDEVHNRPPNPMVNAGAIAVTSVVEGADAAERWARIHQCLSTLAGRTLDVDEAVAASERATGDRNRAIAYLMLASGMIRPEVEEVLDLYVRQCSVLVTAADLALMGATLANGGRQPIDGAPVFSGPQTSAILSVMSSCGMYDASGEWIYRVGLPAKSGVGGGVLAILPGHAAIAVYSPRLDDRGNSVRGTLVCEELSRTLGLHTFEDRPAGTALRAVHDRTTIASLHGRTPDDEAVLRAHGGEIVAIELQGVLRFAGVERLGRRIAESVDGIHDLILDVRRVTAIEPVATRLFVDVVEEARARGITVSSSGSTDDRVEATTAAFEARGVEPPLSYIDLDLAVEAAEDRLLARHGRDPVPTPVGLDAIEVCARLDADERAALAALAGEVRVAAGHVVARPGEEGAAWLVQSGLLAVSADDDGSPGRRLRTVGPGSILGEMALLSGAPRSAWVWAQTDVVAREVTPATLARLAAECPEGALALVRSIGAVLAERLRRTDRAPGSD